ncbi:dehydratase family-domain-containing protein [Suillus lakei]|nr:dehydratase family-domain-containing protein [Suillus lakei]
MTNTMSSALEVLGMSLPYSSTSTPGTYPEKAQECFKVAKYMKPRAADVPLTIDDFQIISYQTPYLADLKPSGRYYIEDVHKIGGIPAIIKYLLKNTDLINGSQMTVTGKTLAENLVDVSELNFDNQDIIKKLDNPIKPSGHLTIFKGSLAPGVAVAKLTGKEGLHFEGAAKCFDSVHDFYPVLERRDIKPGMVLLFRYQGPGGVPGMPKMLGTVAGPLEVTSSCREVTKRC